MILRKQVKAGPETQFLARLWAFDKGLGYDDTFSGVHSAKAKRVCSGISKNQTPLFFPVNPPLGDRPSHVSGTYFSRAWSSGRCKKGWKMFLGPQM